MSRHLKRPKTVRFNISGNRLFKDEEPSIVIEDTGCCLDDYTSEEEYEKHQEYLYSHPTTFRDIAILLYMGCGQGVMWHMARELSSELNISEKYVAIIIRNIVRKYAEMSEEEAMEKYNKLGNYIDTGMLKDKEK